MPVELDTSARDGSSYSVVCTFTDEDDSSVTPSSVTWTLLGPGNAVINGREDVSVTPSAGQATITLGPADLAYADGSHRKLILTWTYDSSYGAGQTGREQVTFNVDDIAEKAA